MDVARLLKLDMETNPDSTCVKVLAKYRLEEQDSFVQIVYQILGNGIIKVEMSFIPGQKPLPEMPRFGMRMIIPKEYDQMTWFGRGPHENYADRKTSTMPAFYTERDVVNIILHKIPRTYRQRFCACNQ